MKCACFPLRTAEVKTHSQIKEDGKKKKNQHTHTLNPHGDCDLALPVASTYATICVTEIKKIKDEILILLELAFLFGFLLGSVAICRLATAKLKQKSPLCKLIVDVERAVDVLERRAKWLSVKWFLESVIHTVLLILRI